VSRPSNRNLKISAAQETEQLREPAHLQVLRQNRIYRQRV